MAMREYFFHNTTSVFTLLAGAVSASKRMRRRVGTRSLRMALP
jgi:hypothetical protein